MGADSGNVTQEVLVALQKYCEERGVKTREEMDALIPQFVEEYNQKHGGSIPAETPETGNDYLNLAYTCEDQAQAIAYAKQALEMEPDNLDAEVLIAELSAGNTEELLERYEKLLKKAEKRLKEEGLFDEECIGGFYGIFETRPYIRLLNNRLTVYAMHGKMRLAIEECKNILKLNESDNLGVRYQLMHLYAFLEDERNAEKTFKQFGSPEDVLMLLPLTAIYYKKNQYNQATKYLNRIKKANTAWKMFFERVLEEDLDQLTGEYEPGYGYAANSEDEFLVALFDYPYLYGSTPGFLQWAARTLLG